MEDTAGIADPLAASDAGCLRHVIRTLHERADRRVVVLIDQMWMSI